MSEHQVYTGAALKVIREGLGLDLRAMEQETKVRWIHYDAIENDLYAKLPAEVFLRGYLKLYARKLALDPQRVVSDYMSAYKAWSDKEGRKR